MSVRGKKWNILNTTSRSVVDKILENRGLSDPEDLERFIKPDFEKGFHDPFLFPGMQKIVDRIYRAIEKEERIIVYGDYDVDGISGAAIVFLTLEHLGGKVSYRLPHRLNDGYGMSEKYIKEFEEANVGLVITVDCGVSNVREISLAKEKGIDVIVTDHHKIPENYPHDAYEVLHPLRKDSMYPFKKLTGAGVAFKLAQALLKTENAEHEHKNLTFSLLDLASLGTVADCGPIVGENRLIVKKGLEMLPQTKWEGLKFLQELAGVKFDKPLNTHTIGFQIAPRINAAGRIDSPYYALQLLINNQETAKAKRLAGQLERLNRKRQNMLKTAMNEAELRVRANRDRPIIIEYDKKWHVGIIGLVAGRLAEKYTRPAIILQEFDDYLVASARSPEFFNIIEALTDHSEFLDHYGGHAQAAGFNISKDKLQDFIQAITRYAEKKLSTCDCSPELAIECEIKPDEINWDTLEFIRSLEPFGIGNNRPRFLLKGITLSHARTVGRDNRHLSMSFDMGGKQIRGIAFNFGEHVDYARKHRSLDVVFQLEENNWKGRKSLQMKLVDFK
ncbi:single-stranded-DNA-specific exonuclease RecJ [Candidatus Peregrinibacteria bacterium]|nr:single-stranded-DNA-specific exonuclease RecJ [Candidatus Peregrinibacteria bacterium]